MRHAAIVLAAGESSRMGRSKATLPVEGRTALDRVTSACRAAGCDPVVVVLGRDAEQVKASVDLKGCTVAINARPEQGRTSSLQAGLHRVPAGVQGVVVFPVDHFLAGSATLSALRARHGATRAAVVVPAYHGQRGHPVLLDARLRDGVEALRPDQPLRDLVRAYTESTEEVQVNDLGVVLNIDTPEDYREALARMEVRARLRARGAHAGGRP